MRDGRADSVRTGSRAPSALCSAPGWSAYFLRASTILVGRCWLGQSPSTGWYSFRTERATEFLCTSVGPSTSPMIGAVIHRPPNGSSSETPRAPWTWMARWVTSWRIFGVSTLMAAMSLRTARWS